MSVATKWNDEKNERRCQLIDKKIDGTIATDEKEEMEDLQQQMLDYRRLVAPLPLEEVRQLHQELLLKVGNCVSNARVLGSTNE